MVRKQVKSKIVNITTHTLNNEAINNKTSSKKALKNKPLNSTPTAQSELPLKDRFLLAVVNGDIGRVENSGVIVSLKEFKAYFNDITSDYINSFLPAATIEPGQRSVTNTKYVFRVKKGVYLVHPEVLEDYRL
ncbi:MAG: hypothetical protein OQK98_10650 [Gammaproteobacteria bacterium]|nr:hypothetical protein [Gammaproteobacteria bacterium]